MEPSRGDQRSQRRVEAAITIRVQGVDAAGLTFDDTTTALEVSRRGLSFLTRHDLAVFTTLTVTIPALGPKRPDEDPTDFFAEATVVRSTKQDEEFNIVGVRFIGATLPMYSPEGI
jgi:hypothetical protein